MDETFDIINWVSTGIVTIEYFLRIYAMGEAKDDEVVINIYKYLSICHKDMPVDMPMVRNGYLSISLMDISQSLCSDTRLKIIGMAYPSAVLECFEPRIYYLLFGGPADLVCKYL